MDKPMAGYERALRARETADIDPSGNHANLQGGDAAQRNLDDKDRGDYPRSSRAD